MDKDISGMVEDKSARVGILGIGYVGLPLSIIIARAGYKVFCGDVNKEKISLLNRGLNPLPELKEMDDNELKCLVETKQIVVTDPDTAAANSDIKIICVPTPTLNDNSPDLTSFRLAAQTIGNSLKMGDLVINESTVAPSMTRTITCKILEEKSGFKAGLDFFVVASPERVDPSSTTHTLETIPKIVGGINDASTNLGKLFYQKFIERTIPVSSLGAAEATKMLENAYRALNIGFINEFARFCDACNIDITEVIKAAATKWSFQPHYPGIGVGGHCIPEDPYYLISSAEAVGVELSVLRDAVRSNESMPFYVFDLLKKSCGEMGLELKAAQVVLFGISYKGDTRDIRKSPALVLQNILEQHGIGTTIYDPLFTEKELNDMGFKPYHMEKPQCDIIVVGCDHSQFKTFDFKRIKSLKLIIDGKNILPKQDIPVIGIGTNSNLWREDAIGHSTRI